MADNVVTDRRTHKIGMFSGCIFKDMRILEIDGSRIHSISCTSNFWIKKCDLYSANYTLHGGG